MKLALFGAEGKVGAALKPVLERAGHEVKAIEIGDEPDVRGLDACVDFTTPDAAPVNARAALEQGVSCVVGTTGWDAQPLHELAGVLLASDRLSAACVGPNEDRFRAAIGNGVTRKAA